MCLNAALRELHSYGVGIRRVSSIWSKALTAGPLSNRDTNYKYSNSAFWRSPVRGHFEVPQNNVRIFPSKGQ